MDQNLSCAICLLNCKKPVVCQNGHCFCDSCIKSWDRKNCPTCRIDGKFITIISESSSNSNNNTEINVNLENNPYLTETQKHQASLRKTRITQLIQNYECDLLQLQISNNTLREKLENQENIKKSPIKKLKKCHKCGYTRTGEDKAVLTNSPKNSQFARWKNE